LTDFFAFCNCLQVMYDAFGVRLHAGKQAEVWAEAFIVSVTDTHNNVLEAKNFSHQMIKGAKGFPLKEVVKYMELPPEWQVGFSYSDRMVNTQLANDNNLVIADTIVCACSVAHGYNKSHWFCEWKEEKKIHIWEIGRPCYWKPYAHFLVVLLRYILNLFTCLLQFRSNYFKLPGLESNCVWASVRTSTGWNKTTARAPRAHTSTGVCWRGAWICSSHIYGNDSWAW